MRYEQTRNLFILINHLRPGDKFLLRTDPMDTNFTEVEFQDPAVIAPTQEELTTAEDDLKAQLTVLGEAHDVKRLAIIAEVESITSIAAVQKAMIKSAMAATPQPTISDLVDLSQSSPYEAIKDRDSNGNNGNNGNNGK